MLKADEFAGYVRDALAHLYDRQHLRTHPLASLLGGGRSMREAELRQVLLDAVESLRPPETCPPSSPAWRRYRYLDLRYVKGATPDQTAGELQISVRQAQRERDRALDEMTTLLLERYNSRASSKVAPARSPAQEAVVTSKDAEESDPPTAYASDLEAVQDELFKIGSLPSTEPISLTDAMRNALDIVARLAQDRGARLDVALPEELPAVRVHHLVLCQVLIDLLESAIESNIHPVIHVSAAPSGDTVRLQISVPGADLAAGSPIPEIDARLIATRKLIEFQAGRLNVERMSGGTFRVTLSLPLTRARTLLVIDDNPDVAFLFSRLLRDQGYRVLQASTGPTALRLAREDRPDAITLDVLMPSQHGWDLLQTLSQDPETRDIPVIVCSVLPERSLALSLGVAGFLDKPVTREALLAALQRCVPTREPA